MRIVKLHIYGFGQHTNEVIELDRNFTLLYGLNEAGKTTIYEFILQVLFGFPQKNHVLRSYEPKHGGAFGGKIEIEDAQMGRCIVERVGGKSGGIVKVVLEDGNKGGEELLLQLLRGYTRADLESVFAFSMHQLQNLHQMTQDELNRTLVASGTTGVEQITKLEKQLLKESNQLFKKSGQNPVINQQMKAIQLAEIELKEERQRIEEYGPKHAEIIAQREVSVELERQQQELAESIQQAQLYLQKEPLLKQHQQLQQQLEQLPQHDFPLKGLQLYEQSDVRLQQLEQELHVLEKRAGELKKDIRSVVDEERLQQLKGWLRSDEQWRQWRMQREQIQQYQIKLEAQIEMKKQLIGVERSALRLDSSLANEGQFKSHLAELREIEDQLRYYKQAIRENNDDLKYSQQGRQRKSHSKQRAKQRLIIPVSIVLIGIILALVLAKWMIALVSIVVACIVVWLLNNQSKQKNNANYLDSDQLERKNEELQQAYLVGEKQQQKLKNTIESYFHQLGLSGRVEEEMYETLFQHIRLLQEQTIEQQQSDDELDRLQQKIASHYEVGCRLLATTVAEDELTGAIQEKIQEQQLKLKGIAYTSEQLAELQNQQMDYEQQRAYLIEQQQQLFAQVHVETAQQFYDVAQQVEERKSMEQQRLHLEQQLGNIASTEAFTAHQLDEMQMKYQMNKERYTEALKHHAQLVAEVQHLVKDERYSILLQQQEQRKSELQENIKQWLKVKMIEQAISKTLEEMQEQRLPSVLAQATEYFETLTNARYKKLVFSDEKFMVVKNDDEHFAINELSQATKEQAYLALRFALANEKQATAPFPLLMDDPFVHFDTLRTGKVVQLLRRLQREHQILFFTCQERMLHDFGEQNIVEVRALQVKGD